MTSLLSEIENDIRFLSKNLEYCNKNAVYMQPFLLNEIKEEISNHQNDAAIINNSGIFKKTHFPETTEKYLKMIQTSSP